MDSNVLDEQQCSRQTAMYYMDSNVLDEQQYTAMYISIQGVQNVIDVHLCTECTEQ